MGWFRLDDGFGDHPKIIEVGNPGAGLYARCGAWCAKHLTDGYIPEAMGRSWGHPRTAQALEISGLWVPVHGGWQMHDYLDYNPSREDAEADKKAAAQRQKAYRERIKGGSQRTPPPDGNVTPNVTHNATRDSRNTIPYPIPSHPITPPSSVVSMGGGGSGGNGATSPPRRGRPPSQGTRIPDDFAVTPDMVEWAREHAPHVNGKFETEQFKDYWTAKSGKDATKKDWVATWRWWMRKAEQQAGRNNGHRRPTSEVRFADAESLRERLRKKREIETTQLQLPRGSA